MLPFDAPTTFTAGQRQRSDRNRTARRRSYTLVDHKPQNKSSFCSTKLILLLTLFGMVIMLYAALSQPSGGKDAAAAAAGGGDKPVLNLQRQTGLLSTEFISTDSPLEAGLGMGGPAQTLEERLQSAQALTRLNTVEAELQSMQIINKKLARELEKTKVELAVAKGEEVEAGGLSTLDNSNAVALSSTGGPAQVPSYPPIAIAANKKYSQFYCIGGRGRLGAQNDRSCRFQNICYKPSTDSWQFYQDPSKQLVVLLDKGEIISEFPREFLNLRSMGNPTDAQWWSPELVQSEEGIPESAFVPRSDPERPTVNLLFHPHYPSNMGHVIGDDLFPLFNLMSSFGMLVSDAQLILSRDCNRIFEKFPKKAAQCDHFLNMLIPGLSSRQYLAATDGQFVPQLLGASSNRDLVCFEQLLVGNGPWGFQQSLGKAPSWWSYHAFYLNNLGINPNRTPKKQRITVSIKKGKRALANNDELVEYLREKFPQYEVDALELKSLGSWKAELEYLLDTSILITPCGGVSMSAMFLPHNAAMIIVDYFNTRKNVSFGMEERLWSNLGYVRPFHYPFTKDEVELPEGRNPDDYQDMRDWGQVRVNLQRMETLVHSAIAHVDNFMVLGQE